MSEIRVKEVQISKNSKTTFLNLTSEGAFESVEPQTGSISATPITIANLFGKLETRKLKVSQFNSFRISKEYQLQDMLSAGSYNEITNF